MKLGFIARNDLDGIEQDAQFAAEYGLRGLEFNYWKEFAGLDADTVARTREILDRHGVQAASIGLWGWNHIAADPAERDEAHRQLDRAIEFGQTLGAEILITGGGHLAEASIDENADEFVQVVTPFVERAGEAGMKVALYGFHGGSFLMGLEGYEALWHRGADVGVKLDPANVVHAGQDWLPILRHHTARVYHLHIKEHLYVDGELVSQPAAGMGDIPWGKVFAFLHEGGYERWLVIEPHGSPWSREPMRRKMLLLTQRYVSQFML